MLRQITSKCKKWKLCQHLVQCLEKGPLEEATRRSHSLSAKEQVLITLRFLASGSFLEVGGDTFLSYDKSTVSRVVRRVTQALSSKVNDFIKFPSTRNERHEIKRGLFKVGGFPCAIGCIDARIKAPWQNEPDYVNRKGYHSINVQAVCNHEGKQWLVNNLEIIFGKKGSWVRTCYVFKIRLEKIPLFIMIFFFVY